MAPPLPPVAAGLAIPRVIHQVYATRQLPAELERNVAALRLLNPGWDYRLYDDDDMAAYISEAYGTRVRAFYERIDRRYGAARADLFRYLLIYREGGVYLDVKSSLAKPLDEVLRPDDVYVLSTWRNGPGERYSSYGRHAALRQHGGQELQQWHVIAAQGHPFLRNVLEHVMLNIERYHPLTQSTGKGGVLRVTGPIAYTRAIMPILDRHAHRWADSETELGLVYSIYDTAAAGVGQRHKAIFKTHYTDLREPVVELSGLKQMLWLTFGPLQNAVRRVRNRVQR